MNNYSAGLIIYQALPYLLFAQACMGRAAEERLRTDEAKISDKAPPRHEIRGGQIKKKKKAWRSQRMLLCRANESDAFSWPAFNCNQEFSKTITT